MAPREIIRVNKQTNKSLGYYLPGPTGSREISDSPTSFDVDLARGRCRGRGPPWREFRLLPVWSGKVPGSGFRSAGLRDGSVRWARDLSGRVAPSERRAGA